VIEIGENRNEYNMWVVNTIFINIVKYNNFIVYPLVNGMSDYVAQIVVIHDIIIPNDDNYFYYTRKFNKSLFLDFNFKLP
jgi:hypothetical protein